MLLIYRMIIYSKSNIILLVKMKVIKSVIFRLKWHIFRHKNCFWQLFWVKVAIKNAKNFCEIFLAKFLKILEQERKLFSGSTIASVKGTWFDKKEPKKRTCFILKERQVSFFYVAMVILHLSYYSGIREFIIQSNENG